jgi:predicted HTH transcriptional regulator
MAIAEEFDTLDLNGIKQYVRTQQEEDVSLEFKTARTTNLSYADDRKNLAKALSGFGNSSGGLLVWGVEAGKNADQIDCATRTCPLLRFHNQ